MLKTLENEFQLGFASKFVSFTPGFSPVQK